MRSALFRCLVPVCRHSTIQFSFTRGMANNAGPSTKRGLLLGIFEDGAESSASGYKLTPDAKKHNEIWNGNLVKMLERSGLPLKKGKNRLFFGLDEKYDSVAVVSLGAENAAFNSQEQVNEKLENIRVAVAGGVLKLREIGINSIDVDICTDGKAAAEGGTLGLYCFDQLKAAKSRKIKVQLQPLHPGLAEWHKGVEVANGQNVARRLMETPANLMTPSIFAQTAKELFQGVPHVTITAHDRAWAEQKKMGSFLSVSNGSIQPPVFLEISYKHPDAKNTKPYAIVGKGITFDSGGISLKPPKDMDKMRADMGGAACMVATILTLTKLEIPINVIGLTPLCENMPSGSATKPGDVVFAMNGKSIQVDNTDAEGRLVLADALCYAETFNPAAIVDLATLTGAMAVALGPGAAGVFTNSDQLWNHLHQAGGQTGDRVWRMPLFDVYRKMMTECDLADLNNISNRTPDGGSCSAACFLKEFVTNPHWAHVDIAGVMMTKGEVPYLCKGMSGRPTRTLVELFVRLSSAKLE